MDVTFSVQKSVTVLHAAFEAQEVKARKAGDHDAAEAWAAHRQAVEDAIWAGNNAALDYLAEHAGYSRVGHHGGAAGRFDRRPRLDRRVVLPARLPRQRPAAAHPQPDPQPVQGPDGVWRTLDSARRSTSHRPAAAAVGERTLEEHLARTLGVLAAMRPDGKAREIVGIDQAVTDLFSTRRRAITPKAAELIARVRGAGTGGRRTRWSATGCNAQATLVTRPRQVPRRGDPGAAPRPVATRSCAPRSTAAWTRSPPTSSPCAEQASRSRSAFDPDAVIETALADVQATQGGLDRGRPGPGDQRRPARLPRR